MPACLSSRLVTHMDADRAGFGPRLMRTIEKVGFERPTAIQAQALPVVLSGRDVIGVAKTGSGKTMAFVWPMLVHIKDQVIATVVAAHTNTCWRVLLEA